DARGAAAESKVGAAEKPKPPKPRFQFYTVLPEKEVIIPEAEVKARKQEEKQGKAPVLGEAYMLQIGSFKTMAEADRLKAQLAMLGVEAKIEIAQIGAATWNRVKVGPFASMASADKTRDLLRQNNVDSVVQKAIGATKAPTQP
ncbi:SPOR domain-containing protein, partial [Methylogaea oryzae]